MRLNLGCGRNKLDGFVNVDIAQEGHEPDVVLDLDRASLLDWTVALGIVEDPAVEYAQLIHVIEHLQNPLALMENLWHVSQPGAICYIRCPHGASDDAWEDPTHVRPYYPGSFMYFAQPTYWRADYGYRGDWRVLRMEMVAAIGQMANNPNYASLSRNSVRELVVTLECVKPARPPERELMDQIQPIYTAG